MVGEKEIKRREVYGKIRKEKLRKEVEKLCEEINKIEELRFGNVWKDNSKSINGRV